MLNTKRRTSRSISESQRFSRSSMQKSSSWPIVATLVLIVMIGFYGYMYYQNNRIQNKMNNLQTSIIEDSRTVSAVVNFINTSIAQNEQQQ